MREVRTREHERNYPQSQRFASTVSIGGKRKPAMIRDDSPSGVAVTLDGPVVICEGEELEIYRARGSDSRVATVVRIEVASGSRASETTLGCRWLDSEQTREERAL